MEIVGAFFFWIVFSMVVGVMASGRGRSGFGWAIIALCISPIVAGIVVMLLPDLEERRRADERAAQADNARLKEERERKEEARRAEARREQEERAERDRKERQAAAIFGADLVVSLEQLRKLHEQEVLSDVEFTARKQQTITGLKARVVSEPPEAFLTALLPLRKNETLTADEMAQIKRVVFGQAEQPATPAPPPPADRVSQASPPAPVRAAATATSNPSSRSCKKCGKPVNPGATKCGYCWTAL
jgi:hypothetical protein